MLQALYVALNTLSTASWLAFGLYCVPSVWRVIHGRSLRRHDLLRLLGCTLAFNRLGFAVVRMRFESVPAPSETAELISRCLMSLFAIVCVLAFVLVIRAYERSLGDFE